MKNLPKILFLIVIILLTSFSQKVFACSCIGASTPYQAYKEAKAVFVGKVVAITDRSGKKITEDDIFEFKDNSLNLRLRGRVNYHFAIQEWFKGRETSKISISTDLNTCEWGLDTNDTYLVYAFDSEKSEVNLRTGTYCYRTDILEKTQDDIHFLRDLIKNKPEARIYGSVKSVVYDTNPFQYTFLKGIKIVAQGRKRKYIAFTDKNGLYRFSKLPNGKYKVFPALPSKYRLQNLGMGIINLVSGSKQTLMLDYRTPTVNSAYLGFEVASK